MWWLFQGTLMPNFMHKLCSNAIKEMLGLHFLKMISVDIHCRNRIDTQIETRHLYLYISIHICFIAHSLLITRWQFQNTLYLRHCSNSIWATLATWPTFSYGLKPPAKTCFICTQPQNALFFWPNLRCKVIAELILNYLSSVSVLAQVKKNGFAGWILHQPYVLLARPNLSNRKGHQNGKIFTCRELFVAWAG